MSPVQLPAILLPAYDNSEQVVYTYVPWCQLVTFRLWFDSHCQSFASNLQQVANLLCAQVNSGSYPLWDGKWVVAYRLRGEGLVWLIGAMACLLAANHVSSCLLMWAMDGYVVHWDLISSCQSVVTSNFTKALLATSSWCKKRCSKYMTLPFCSFYHCLMCFMHAGRMTHTMNRWWRRQRLLVAVMTIHQKHQMRTLNSCFEKWFKHALNELL